MLAGAGASGAAAVTDVEMEARKIKAGILEIVSLVGTVLDPLSWLLVVLLPATIYLGTYVGALSVVGQPLPHMVE